MNGLILEDGYHEDNPELRRLMEAGIKASAEIEKALAKEDAEEGKT